MQYYNNTHYWLVAGEPCGHASKSRGRPSVGVHTGSSAEYGKRHLTLRMADG